MTRLRIFFLKNVMFVANLAATGVGAGLLYIIYEFVLRDHHTDQHIEFHIRTSNYLGVIFALFYVFILLYERPIRNYFNRIGANASIPDSLQLIVEKRLLNEPYFIIAMDMAAWVTAGLVFASFERKFGLPWLEISMNRFDALLTGLVSTTLAFFLLERLLQIYLVPIVFPRGKLYHVRGTRRINLAVRLFAVFIAISLIPLLAILSSLYRVTFSNRPVAESFEMFSNGLWTIIPIVILVGAGLVLILSLNLKKSLDAMVLVLKQVARGKLGQRVNVTSNDEIGYVGDVINDMTQGLMERDRMRQSLDLAMEVQQSLLPKDNLKTGGFDIAAGQIILLCTDGVWEAHNTEGEIFGKKRLYEEIRRHANKGAEKIIEAVIGAVSRFQSDSGAEDDITLIVIKKEEI